MDCKNTIIDDVILNAILKLDKSILSHQKKIKIKGIQNSIGPRNKHVSKFIIAILKSLTASSLTFLFIMISVTGSGMLPSAIFAIWLIL